MTLAITSTPSTNYATQSKKFDKLSRGMTGAEFFAVFGDDLVYVNGDSSEVTISGDVATVPSLTAAGTSGLTFYLDISPPSLEVPVYSGFRVLGGAGTQQGDVEQQFRTAMQITGGGSLHDELDNVTTPIISETGAYTSTTLGHLRFGCAATMSTSGNITMITSHLEDNSSVSNQGSGGANLGRTFMLNVGQRMNFENPQNVNRVIQLLSEASLQGDGAGSTVTNTQAYSSFLSSQDDQDKTVYRAIFEFERNTNSTVGTGAVSFQIYYIQVGHMFVPEHDFEPGIDGL